jgi:transposase
VPAAPEARDLVEKKSLIPREQHRPDIVEKRLNFRIARRFVPIDRLVFLDESGAKTNMTRLYGRSRVGDRCNFALAHGHWKTTTMISALRVDGVIEPATMLFDGPMNAPTFVGYVECCLAPSLRSGDVVVMDNLGAHKAAGVAEAIEAAGASVWYLPAYSPDLNPIEKLWSKIKSWLRHAMADTLDGLVNAAAEAFRRVTPGECANYFTACGYMAE